MLKPILTSFFLVCLTFLNNLMAQTREFEGVYRVNQYKGQANFEYKTVEGDTVLDGSFVMKKADGEALFNSGDQYFHFEGTFKENLPQGNWVFHFGDFKEGERTGLIDNQYQISINGVKETFTGELIDGKPQGDWVYNSVMMQNSEVDQLLFKSTIEFENGVPQKSFRIENERMSLIGRFLRDGLAHDVWELYGDSSPDAIEKWHFSDGLLNRIIFVNQEELDTLQFYENELTNPSVINLDDRFINLLQLNQRIWAETNKLSGSRMNNMLVENANYYRKTDEILSTLGQSTFMPEFKVKVPYFPIEGDEIAALNAISESLGKSQILTDLMLNSAPIQILKLSDDSVSFLVSAVETVEAIYVKPLQEMLNYQEQEILQFVDRDTLLAKTWSSDSRSTTFAVKYASSQGEKTVSTSGPNAGSYSFQGNALTDIERMGAYAFYTLDSIHNEFLKKLSIEEREEELEGLEGQLVSQIGVLNDLIDSLLGVTKEPAVGMLGNIKSNGSDKLKSYSSIQDMEHRISRVVELRQCFEEMGDLARVVSILPDQQAELKDVYTERVWNPFTVTLMDEEQKKRIKAAYDNVLIPFYIKEVDAEFDCDRTSELKELLETTHQQMLDLWESETSVLERKLKRENDPLEVLRLFDAHLTETEN